MIAHSTDETWALGSAVTQADGRFAIAGLARGQVTIEVERHRILSGGPLIDVGAADQVELICERLADVLGRVMIAGKPVARAEVRLYRRMERRSLTLSKDLRGGRSAAGHLRDRRHQRRRRRRHGEPPGRGGRAGRRRLFLELDLTASIAGAVVADKGAPVGGVHVRFAREGDEDGRGEAPSATTAANGSFPVSGVAAGSDRPEVRGLREPWAVLAPSGGERHPAVEVADAASRVTGVQLTAASADLTISGRAVRRGEPVAGIDVIATSTGGGEEARAQSGADGTFLVEGLRQGRYELRARSAYESSISAEAVAKDVVLELPATGKIEGVLRGFRVPPEVTVDGRAGYPQGGRRRVAVRRRRPPGRGVRRDRQRLERSARDGARERDRRPGQQGDADRGRDRDADRSGR